MVKYELDADLDVVAGGRDMAERTYNLVEWAGKQGRSADLIAGACRAANPGNAALQALRQVAETWHLAPAEEGEPP